MEPLEEFAALLAQRDAISEFKTRETIKAEYEAEVKRLWEEAHPKTRRAFAIRTAEGWLGDRLEEVQKPYRERAKAAATEANDERERIGKRMGELAPMIDLSPMEGVSSVYCNVDEASYRTTGSPERYAEGYANVMIEEATAGGVQATKEKTEHGWRVVVPLDRVRCEALKFRAGLSSKDFLRLCWKNGVNPRVFLPFPHGLEEKFGLDFFGGYTKKPEGGAS